MKIEDILTQNCIKLPLSGKSKEAIIKELVDAMAVAGLADNPKELLDSALEREGLMSTGIGKGVAIPHGRARGVKRMAAAYGIAKEPIDFGSLDGLPVQIFFFIATPNNIVADHVRALALVSRILNREGIREQLLRAPDAAVTMAILSQVERLEAK
ncbi:MAG: PTS sugar transporter subunit IIA [Candidatus Edwardsbacteria bacterium]|nr:PTS sugar transporter subunit IIA [Candidatus Edwardsbacteria bacterium]